MTTTLPIDFFAISGRYSRYGELLAIQAATPIVLFEPPVYPKIQADSVDRFAYIFMGLAVLIGVVIPLLNLI